MKFYNLLLMLLVVHTGYSQEVIRRPWMARENRVGLAIGIGKVTYLDKNTSPLIYQSKPRNVRLFYNLETNKMLFAFDVDMRLGSTKSRSIPNRQMFFHEEDYKGKNEDKKFPVGGSFLAGRVGIGAYYKIPSTQNSTFKVATGLKISNELFYPQGWTSAGLFNALSFNPEALVQHEVDEHHSFIAQVRIPAVALLTRLPYHNTVSAPNTKLGEGFLKNTNWAGMNKFLAPSVGLQYHYQFNEKFGAGLNYELGWYRVTEPQMMKAVSQSLLANFYHQL